MTTQMKWMIDDDTRLFTSPSCSESDREMIISLLDHKLLTSHFQPVFSSRNGTVFGFEALARTISSVERPIANIGDLFLQAKACGLISQLDVHCRENAIKNASIAGIVQGNASLFINICPETLMDPAHRAGITDELAEEWGIPKKSIVLEVTEESAINNYGIFKEALAYYKESGYKIAIDDFGAGYGGLKMLSIIEPDFVKIDRHFISNIDKATVKFNLVHSIATACHRIGIKVIAEGIETEDELKVLLNMGIECLQGFHLARPAAGLKWAPAQLPVLQARRNDGVKPESSTIGDIARAVETVPPSASISYVFDKFIKNPDLRGLPVVDGERVVGVFNRIRFLENQVLGRCGYGMHLNLHKKIEQLMDCTSLIVEENISLEHVAQRIQSRKLQFLYDDVCVTRSGKYFGTVAISDLLDAITEKSLALARGANPLSGLPGNEVIQREINARLSQGMHFDVCYIDIDHFKPYNDHYGFERGDMVIKTVADILREIVCAESDEFNFVGHIGGDDFIVISRPLISLPSMKRVLELFENEVPALHGMEDYARGFYLSKNRRGEEERFEPLSLSIGIVSTEVNKIESYAQLASIATEVKKAAKAQRGSSIVRDKRLQG